MSSPVAPYIVAQMIFAAPAAILAEASLSFLGLGDPSFPTWGQMLESGFRTGALYVGYWWWVIPPGVLYLVTAMAFTMLAWRWSNWSIPACASNTERPVRVAFGQGFDRGHEPFQIVVVVVALIRDADHVQPVPAGDRRFHPEFVVHTLFERHRIVDADRAGDHLRIPFRRVRMDGFAAAVVGDPLPGFARELVTTGAHRCPIVLGLKIDRRGHAEEGRRVAGTLPFVALDEGGRRQHPLLPPPPADDERFDPAVFFRPNIEKCRALGEQSHLWKLPV